MKKLLILFFALFSQTGFSYTNSDYYTSPNVQAPSVTTRRNILPAPNSSMFVNLNTIYCLNYDNRWSMDHGCYKPQYYKGTKDLRQMAMTCTETTTGTTFNSMTNNSAVINNMRLTVGFTPAGTYTPMFTNLYDLFSSNMAGNGYNQGYMITVLAEPVAPYTSPNETISITCGIPGTDYNYTGTAVFKRDFASTVSLTQPPSKNGFINQEIDFPFTVTVTDPGQSSVKIRTTFAVSSPCSGWSPELELASGATLDADGVTKGILNSGTNNLHAKFTPTALGSFTCSGTMVVQLD